MKLNKLIDYLFENMDEAALRGFSLDILKKETERLEDELGEAYTEEIGEGLAKLAKKYGLPYMGVGSSRIVFALSTGKVLKIATDEKGLAQTEAEVSVWTNPSTKEVAAEVFDFDPNFRWSVMEIAKVFRWSPKISKNSLEYELRIPQMFGVNVYIGDIVELLLSDRSDLFAGLDPDRSNLLLQISDLPDFQRMALEKKLNAYIENVPPFIEKLADLVHNNDLDLGDIVSSHFGKTADGRIVLIDYGLSKEVAREHY